MTGYELKLHSDIRGRDHDVASIGRDDQESGSEAPGDSSGADFDHGEDERVDTRSELSESEADVKRSRSPPVPAPRKSLRKQQAPAWLRSGDYQCKSVNSSVSQNGWAQKASFLLSLASNDVFKMLPESVSSEILKLVMESK